MMEEQELELPTQETSEDANRLIEVLSHFVKRGNGETAEVYLSRDDQQACAEIPQQVLTLFLEVLGQLANGNAVTIVPIHAELTAQQAADLLNVSRSYLVNLLESNELEYTMVGTHHRIRAQEVIRYKRTRDEKTRQAVAELTALGQELGT
jgi:excisionase family DNA binding protein